MLLGAPSSKKLIFERDLVQLGGDDADRDRQEAKQKLAAALLDRGWQRWAIVLIPIKAEAGLPNGVKLEIDKGEIKITGLETPQTFTAVQLEAAMGLATEKPPEKPQPPAPQENPPDGRPPPGVHKPQPPPPSGHRYAFFVGVQGYDNASQHLPRLNWTLNDVRDLCRTFRLAGYECSVMSDDQPDAEWRPDSAEKIRARLNEWLRNRTPADNVVVGFSGHGLQLERDKPLADGTRETYFCPRNADIDNPATLLPFVADVFKSVGDCRAANKLILIDACRERYETGNGASRDSKIVYPGVATETRNPTKAVITTGLSVIYSCGEGGKSAESSVLQHGIFIHFVLEAAQRAQQSPLRLCQLADELSGRTEEYTKHVQVPILQFNSANWDVFAPMKPAAAKVSERLQVWLALDWSEQMQHHRKEMCQAMQELVRGISSSDQERLRVLLVAQDCVTWPLAQVLQGELPAPLPAPHDKQTIKAAAMAVALARREPGGVLLGFISWNPRYSIPDDFERDWKAANESLEHGGHLEQHAQEVHFRVMQVLGDNDAVRQVFNRLADERYQQYDDWPTQLPGPMQIEMQDDMKR